MSKYVSHILMFKDGSTSKLSVIVCHYDDSCQGIVGCTPTNVPLWEIPILALYSGYLWVIIPQESLENTINTMGTLSGVHPILL